MRSILTAILLPILMLAGAAWADEEPGEGQAGPLTPEQAADAVLDALKTPDDGTLRALAAKDGPDPWIVADELCYRGEYDAAEAFATAAPRKTVEKLPAYVESRRGKEPDDPARKALAAMNQAQAMGETELWLGHATGVSGPLDSVVRIQIAYGRGLALRHMDQQQQSADVLLEVGAAAARVGWLSRASVAFHEGALSAQSDSDSERATSAWKQQLSVSREIGDLRGVAEALEHLGIMHNKGGDFRGGLRSFSEALSTWRAIGNKRGIAGALTGIGSAECFLGRYPEALRAHRESLSIAREIGDRGSIAAALGNMGYVQERIRNYPEALRLHRESLRIEREIGNESGAAVTLVNIGNVQRFLGNYPEALQAYRESLSIVRETGNKRRMAAALMGIGNMQLHLGRYPEGLRSYRRSLSIAREIDYQTGIAEALGGVGCVQRLFGDYPEALQSFGHALSIAREIDHKFNIAHGAKQVGTVHGLLGNYPEALASYSESLSIFRELGDAQGIASVLLTIGGLQEHLGDYPEALRSFDESLAISRGLGHKYGIAAALRAVGGMQRSMGNHAEARRLYSEALSISREIGDKDGIAAVLTSIAYAEARHENFAEALQAYGGALSIYREIGSKRSASTTLANIGSTQAALGNYPEALQSYRDSLSIQREMGNKTGIAGALTRIGTVQQVLGNYHEALEAHEQAFDMVADIPTPGAQVHVLWGLADLHLRMGRSAQAIRFARQGVDFVLGLAEGLAEGEGASTRDPFAELFSIGAEASLASGQVDDLLWFLEQGRAGSLRESLGSRSALEAAVMPSDLRRTLALARHAERQAVETYRQARGTSKRKAILAARQVWEEAQAEVSRVAKRAEREAKRASAVTLAEPDELGEIQGYLDDDEALVVYALTSAEGIALVLTKEGARMAALPASQDIAAATDALLDDDLFVDPDQVPALRKLLIAPLELGEDVKRVLVSPTGRLGYVPFTLLFPNREVAYVPSGTTYGLLVGEKEMRGERVLALGDPDYETAVDATALRVRAGNLARLSPLPATREEVGAIADAGVLGEDATETALQALVSRQERWRAIHFACHGLVDPERPMLSALALTADDENDGFVTALEIFGMKLPADLVALSACETAKGKIYQTEGIVGLTRAFMFAGAPRVLCSLWKVDDEATQALMIEFYELWNPKDGSQGLGAAAALKEAQEYVRDHPDHPEWKHPYYWAAWVLWGLPD